MSRNPNSPVTGTITDPEFRHRRAVHAAKSRTSIEHHIAALVARAPELSVSQRDKIVAILRPAS